MDREQTDRWRGILAQVERGEIKPSEAEAIARVEGLDPFELKPNNDKYDPMTESHWTLAMALAWVCWRSPTQVRQAWSKYRDALRYWAPTYHYDGSDTKPYASGYHLARLPTPTLQSVSLAATHLSQEPWIIQESTVFAGRTAGDLESAQDELWSQLSHGRLTAEGISTSTGSMERIPAAIWALCQTRTDILRGGDEARADALFLRGDLNNTAYTRVRLKSREALSLWPAHEKSARTKKTSPKVARERRPRYRWAAFDAYLMGLLELHSSPDPSDPSWPSQAHIEEVMAEWCTINMSGVPADSTIRSRVKLLIEQYQTSKRNSAQPT